MIVIDIGNTKIAIGLVKNGPYIRTWKMSSRPQKSVDEYKQMLNSFLQEEGTSLSQQKNILLASVVPHLTNVFCEIHSNVTVVDHHTPLTFDIAIEHAETLGADRIADAEGALVIFPQPLIIVDFGTATTMTVVNEKRQLIGGMITLGLGLSAKALFEQTASLKEVPLEIPARAIGKNTQQAIQSGLCYGHISMIKEMVNVFQMEMNQANVNVLCTGGSLQILSNALPTNWHQVPNLTLKGLVEIAKQLKLGGTYV